MNTGLSFDRSYYLATAARWEQQPALTGEAEADLVIVGGGATGLSAALHAAEAGLSVILLEGGRIGWGASGRNGGQIIRGLRQGAGELTATLGRPKAAALLRLAFEARDLVVDLIKKHAIDCDLRLSGHLHAAVGLTSAAQMREDLKATTDLFGEPVGEWLDAPQITLKVRSNYAGGTFDPGGGHLHPLNYTLGLARAAVASGARLHEKSRATRLRQEAGGVRVETGTGTVRARHAVLAGDALMRGLAGSIEARIMPVASYIAATAPLGDLAAHLIPSDAAVSDSRFVVSYYRRTADNRILFGGGERYTPSAPADIARFVRPHMEKTFPALKGVQLDYAWGGLVSVTRSRLPHLGRDGAVLCAHGYSGMGAVLSSLAGKLMVEAISGASARFDLFADVTPKAFPGGTALRTPLHVAGMLWYALRDRLHS